MIKKRKNICIFSCVKTYWLILDSLKIFAKGSTKHFYIFYKHGKESLTLIFFLFEIIFSKCSMQALFHHLRKCTISRSDYMEKKIVFCSWKCCSIQWHYCGPSICSSSHGNKSEAFSFRVSIIYSKNRMLMVTKRGRLVRRESSKLTNLKV